MKERRYHVSIYIKSTHKEAIASTYSSSDPIIRNSIFETYSIGSTAIPFFVSGIEVKLQFQKSKAIFQLLLEKSLIVSF